MKRAVLIVITVMLVIVISVRVLGAGASTGASLITVQKSSRVFQAIPQRSLRSVHRIAAPVVDGDLSDWQPGDSIDVNRNTAYSFSGRISDTADLSATVRSGWTEDTLYFAIQVSDDVIVTDSADVWRDDGVEIGLDGLRDGLAWGADDHQYTIVADGRVSNHSVLTEDVRAALMAYDGGYSMEVAIPTTKLISGVPVSGTIMGFTIGVHDDDDGGNWDAYLIWEGTNTSSFPEQFGSLIFAERPEDRLAILEARIAELEAKVQKLLEILHELERVPPP